MNSAQELALFVENNQERFYRIAYTYVKSREDALDVIHDAIVKALQSYHTLRRPEYAKTWFYLHPDQRVQLFSPQKQMSVVLGGRLSSTGL